MPVTDVVRVKPVLPPIERVVLTMTEEEALALKSILGQLGLGELEYLFKNHNMSFTDRSKHYVVVADIWNSMDLAGVKPS